LAVGRALISGVARARELQARTLDALAIATSITAMLTIITGIPRALEAHCGPALRLQVATIVLTVIPMLALTLELQAAFLHALATGMCIAAMRTIITGILCALEAYCCLGLRIQGIAALLAMIPVLALTLELQATFLDALAALLCVAAMVPAITPILCTLEAYCFRGVCSRHVVALVLAVVPGLAPTRELQARTLDALAIATRPAAMLTIITGMLHALEANCCLGVWSRQVLTVVLANISSVAGTLVLEAITLDALATGMCIAAMRTIITGILCALEAFYFLGLRGHVTLGASAMIPFLALAGKLETITCLFAHSADIIIIIAAMLLTTIAEILCALEAYYFLDPCRFVTLVCTLVACLAPTCKLQALPFDALATSIIMIAAMLITITGVTQTNFS
jgi:hypothetical protein